MVVLSSYVFDLPALLLRASLRNPQLDHARHRCPHARFLHRREVLQGADPMGIHVLCVPPGRRLLDHTRTHRRVRLVEPAARSCRLTLIHQIYVFYKKRTAPLASPRIAAPSIITSIV